jgi:hypothetical protein
VTGQHHRDAFRNAGANEVANRGAAEVVGDQPIIKRRDDKPG